MVCSVSNEDFPHVSHVSFPGKDLEPYFSEPSNESLALDASEKLLAMYIAYCKKRSFQDVFVGLMAKQMVEMYI